MGYVTVCALIFCAFLGGSYGEQIEEEVTSPKPYAFSYTAGRFPGNVDRVHAETGDGSGVIRGMFSYVDPRQKIRTVEYIADQNGFHPILITNPAVNTRAVENEKAKHYTLYNQIAAEHQRIAAERGQNGEVEEENYEETSYDPNLLLALPQDTPVVERAKLRHYDLYNKISEQHARIAAERGDFETQASEERTVKIGY